jgi:prefoldin subunit 5
LLQEVGEARQEVASHLAKVHEALPGLAVQLETDAGRVGASGDDAVKAWDEAHEDLSAAHDRLEKEAEELVAARTDLQRHLAEVGSKVDQSQAEGEAAVGALETEAQEAETKLTAAAQAVGEEVNELKQFLDVARSSLQDACAVLAQRLLSLGEEMQHEAEQIIEDLRAKHKEHLEHSQDPLVDMADHVLANADDTGERVQRNAATPSTDAGLELRTELERLSATAEKGEEALRREGQELEQALAQLAGEADRIPEGIRQIDQAARTLGL